MSKQIYLNRILLIISIAVLFMSITVAQVHTIDKSFLVEPGGTLHMDIAHGDVIIRGWEYDEVRVQADVYGTARILDQLEIRLEQDANDVIVRTKRTGRRRIPGRGYGSRHERIEFTVNVPYMYHVRVHFDEGRVDVDDLDGSVRVRSGR